MGISAGGTSSRTVGGIGIFAKYSATIPAAATKQFSSNAIA
jgi:hypothetical protein